MGIIIHYKDPVVKQPNGNIFFSWLRAMPWSQLPQHPSIRTRRDDDVLCAMCFLGKKKWQEFSNFPFKNRLQIFFLGDKNLAMKLGRGRENFFPTDFSVAKHGPNNFLKTTGFGG